MSRRSPDQTLTNSRSMLASKLVRTALLALLMTAAVSAARLASPGGAFACSCAMPKTLVEYRAEPNVVILAGTIAAVNGEAGTFAVERVFKGPVPGPNLQIRGGDSAMCGVPLKLAARIVMVAYMEAGVVHPSSCSPFATLPSAEGDALLAEAEAAFGGAAPPGGATEPADPPSAAPLAGSDVALPIVLLAVLVVVGGLFGLIALMSRRGRRGA